jgi:hypothetical protein
VRFALTVPLDTDRPLPTITVPAVDVVAAGSVANVEFPRRYVVEEAVPVPSLAGSSTPVVSADAACVCEELAAPIEEGEIGSLPS